MKKRKKNQESSSSSSSSSSFIIKTLPKECLIEIFLYLDGNVLFNVMLTCKHFHWVIDNTTFWKQSLKKKESWKDLCREHSLKNIHKPTAKNLYHLAKISLKINVENSPILDYIYGLCKKASKLDYWGIYFDCFVNAQTNLGRYGWDNKENKLCYFDFYRDNDDNKYFNAREIFDTILSYGLTNLLKVKNYLKIEKGIILKMYEFKEGRLKFCISWENFEGQE